MEEVLIKSSRKIAQAPKKIKRYLFDKINFNQRLIAVKGARGTGKTTLLLQIGATFTEKKTVYVSLDDLFFTENTLHGFAENFYQIGGELLLLDEVHKYPNWSREIKLIYDDFPDLQVIFTSSSMLDIYRGESDLSRRAMSYELKSLSFREYLLLFKNIDFPSVSLEEIVNNNSKVANKIAQKIKPLAEFSGYLKHGAYPYFLGDETEYFQQLRQTINLILEVDLPAVQNVDYQNVAKIKRLLYVLAVNVPFTPNISKLSEMVGLQRNSLVQVLQWLSKAHLVHTYFKTGKSIQLLNKPDKIWLENTNLSYAITQKTPDVGTMRETFFLSQLAGLHEISLPKKGDFFVDNTYIFEIGGKNKKQDQIKDIANGYIVKDRIETGVLNTIPLWLFGFLY